MKKNEKRSVGISVAVDLLVFTVEQERLKVLLIERAE